MATSPLTARQREIADYIENYIRCVGFPPTVREIATAHGIGSPRGVICHLDALERKGVIQREPNVSRGICMAKQGFPILDMACLGGVLRQIGNER